MNAQQISSAIINGKLSNDDLNLIIQSIKFARSNLVNSAKNQIAIGKRVKWTGKFGAQTGTVTKVAIKYASVSTATGAWKVPLNMLELV
jgi:hypothetical protein